ncbi:MAG: DNA-directed RNA polymerase subunit omega [Planctomycetota bacterium]|nr:DNA-directed RNA polymerase subunit omega [Planctomycetota bacterium]
MYESLHDLPLDELAEKVGGRYRLARLVSLRLRAINSGAPFLVAPKENEAPLATVCREILEGKIWLDVAEQEVVAPTLEADYSAIGEMGEDLAGEV